MKALTNYINESTVVDTRSETFRVEIQRKVDFVLTANFDTDVAAFFVLKEDIDKGLFNDYAIADVKTALAYNLSNLSQKITRILVDIYADRVELKCEFNFQNKPVTQSISINIDSNTDFVNGTVKASGPIRPFTTSAIEQFIKSHNRLEYKTFPRILNKFLDVINDHLR